MGESWVGREDFLGVVHFNLFGASLLGTGGSLRLGGRPRPRFGWVKPSSKVNDGTFFGGRPFGL